MSKEIKDCPPHFIHPGGVFVWEPASLRQKKQLFRQNQCTSALEMSHSFQGFSKASVPGFERQEFR